MLLPARISGRAPRP